MRLAGLERRKQKNKYADYQPCSCVRLVLNPLLEAARRNGRGQSQSAAEKTHLQERTE